MNFPLVYCLKIKIILISGNKHFQSVLNDCTKQNAVMEKAMVPSKKYPKRDRDKSLDRRDRDRSPKRYDHSHGSDHKSGKSGQKRNYSGHGGGGSGSGSSKDKGKKPRSSSSKKKGMSSDLSDTFYSFLGSKAIQMVKLHVSKLIVLQMLIIFLSEAVSLCSIAIG